MRFKLLTAAVLTGLSIGVTATEFTSSAPSIGELVNNGTTMNVRVIAHAKLGQLEAMKTELAAYGAEFHVEGSNWVAVTVGVTTENYQELLNLSPVLSVEKDQERQSIPLNVRAVSAQDLANTETTPGLNALYRFDGDEAIPYGIEAVQAYGFNPNPAHMPKVCIVDTGYNFGHPDLPTSNVDGTDDGAGPWYIDGHGHGTHVAGTVAAKGGNVVAPGFNGVVGVIPNGTDLHIVRVFNDAGGFVYASDLAGAVQDCAEAGAKVVSMSLGGILSTKAEKEALKDVVDDGALLFAAAGNDGNASHSYPASYDFVHSVAAVDEYNEHASFSQRTAQVQFAAPGVDVLSTVPGGFAFSTGTSMSTPHVSGVAATVWSHFPECDSISILEALQMSAKDLDEEGYDYKTGWGLIQTQAAYDLLTNEGC